MSISPRDGGLAGGMRALAMVAAIIGGLGAAALVLYFGSRNPSRLLILMFVGWVLAPFMGLGWAIRMSNRWPAVVRKTLYVLALLIAPVSLVVYADVAFGPPTPQPARFFLLVPVGSWLCMAVAVAIAASIARRQRIV